MLIVLCLDKVDYMIMMKLSDFILFWVGFPS